MERQFRKGDAHEREINEASKMAAKGVVPAAAFGTNIGSGRS